MCLAVPGKIVAIAGARAEIDVMGNRATADLSALPEARVGDYVIVHAGLAIEKYDEEEALRTIDLFRELAAMQ